MKKVEFILSLFSIFTLTLYGAQNRCEDKNLDIQIPYKNIKKDTNDLDCVLKSIHIYLKSGQVERGFELLIKLYNADPNYIKHKKIFKIINIAKYIVNLKQRAIKYNDINAWNELGITYYKMGVFNESIKAYSKSLQIDPNQIEPRLTLALDFSRSDQAYRAIEELDRVIKLDKDNFFAYYYAGKILKYQIKDINKSKRYLLKAIMLCKLEKKELGDKLYKTYIKDLKDETK